MKNFWKWVLGIVIVLVLLAAVPFIMHYALGVNTGMMGMYSRGGWDQGHFDSWRHPEMMSGRGFMPFYGGFFMFAGLFRLFIPLALLGLLAYGAYSLGKRNASPAIAPANEPAPEPVRERTCANCGKAAQGDWTTCPYCGTTL